MVGGMRLEDGAGTIINTDSSPPSLYDQLMDMQDTLDAMFRQYQKMGRTKERQALWVKMNNLEVRYKTLYMKYKKEQEQKIIGNKA
jgi:hypothetical protein